MHSPPAAHRTVRLRRALLLTAFVLALVLFGIDRYAAWTHLPSDDSNQVVLYTTTWCPYCKRLRADLTASHVLYVEYDVEKSLAGQLGMWALRGRGVPVSVIGSKIVYGYQVEEIYHALRAIGYLYTPVP